VGGEAAGRAADRLVATGVIAAVPTAASGLSDWSDLHGETRRIGTVHALGNITALVLYMCSWLSRRRGHRSSGVVLSTAGYAVATLSAWLGGHLSFVKGVGVNQTAFEAGPEKWTSVTAPATLAEDDRATIRVKGADVLVVRSGRSMFALSDRCSHRGCSLAEGEIHDGTVTCACHGSTFRLADGAVVRGPATAAQPSYEVRTHKGELQLRQRHGR
jgi:nitrite reductase/ring-hydroxylating ferredoxin subunit